MISNYCFKFIFKIDFDLRLFDSVSLAIDDQFQARIWNWVKRSAAEFHVDFILKRMSDRQQGE